MFKKNKYKDEYIDYTCIMRDKLIGVISNSGDKILDIDRDALCTIRAGGVYYIIINALYSASIIGRIVTGFDVNNVYGACLKLLKFSDNNLNRFIIPRIKLATDDLLWFCKSMAYLDQVIQDTNTKYNLMIQDAPCIPQDRFISHLKLSLYDDEDGDITFTTLAYMSLKYETGILDTSDMPTEYAGYPFPQTLINQKKILTS